ncbi:MAG: hypothetical protein DME28_03390 [Verrucomicrobia bacterium]|nr:MAG: hypothetical protein DME28_03390 [Verrucomicrobiota bacterium]
MAVAARYFPDATGGQDRSWAAIQDNYDNCDGDHFLGGHFHLSNSSVNDRQVSQWNFGFLSIIRTDTNSPMKTKFPQVLITALVASLISTLHAQDPSIDRLLSKLPPPEKIAKPPLHQAVQTDDPAAKDPLVRQVLQAALGRNLPLALNLSRKLAERYPRSAGAQILRGYFAIDVQQYAEATTALHSAIAIQPRLTLAHFGLALIEGKQNHFAAAMPHLRRVVEIDPKAAGAYYALSDCALRTGRKQESVEYAQKAAALAPQNVYMWIQLARAERSLGHTDATLNAIARGADVSPDSAPMLAAIGFSYINLDRIPQAIPPLRRAAQLLPQDYLVQSQLGFCLQATGQVDSGISYLRKGASLNPSYGTVWEHLGLAYQKKGNHREAITAFEKATQLMPNAPRPWQHLADEYRIAGRAADAARATTRAQQLGGSTVKVAKKKS